MDKKYNSLSHVGVAGMKWGVRRGRSEQVGLIPKLLGRKSNFRIGKKKGQSDAEFDKEYAAEISDKATKAFKKVAPKKMSFVEREQKRRAVTRKLVVNALLVVGTIKALDLLAGAGKAKYADIKQNKYGGFDPSTVVNAKFNP